MAASSCRPHARAGSGAIAGGDHRLGACARCGTWANLFQIIRADREMHELKLRIGHDVARLKDSEESLRLHLHESISVAVEVALVLALIDEQELLKLGPTHKIPRVTMK